MNQFKDKKLNLIVNLYWACTIKHYRFVMYGLRGKPSVFAFKPVKVTYSL
jgi:hypothetical protein